MIDRKPGAEAVPFRDLQAIANNPLNIAKGGAFRQHRPPGKLGAPGGVLYIGDLIWAWEGRKGALRAREKACNGVHGDLRIGRCGLREVGQKGFRGQGDLGVGVAQEPAKQLNKGGRAAHVNARRERHGNERSPPGGKKGDVKVRVRFRDDAHATAPGKGEASEGTSERLRLFGDLAPAEGRAKLTPAIKKIDPRSRRCGIGQGLPKRGKIAKAQRLSARRWRYRGLVGSGSRGSSNRLGPGGHGENRTIMRPKRWRWHRRASLAFPAQGKGESMTPVHFGILAAERSGPSPFMRQKACP